MRANPVFKEDKQYFQLVLPLDGGIDSQKSSQKSSQKIVSLMAENPNITINQLADIIGVSDRTIKKYIASLQSENIIKRVGPDKGGHWEVLQ
jgi:ATP-dependent DNA helicase RecG